MGTPSYMRSFVDPNVFMRRMTVDLSIRFSYCCCCCMSVVQSDRLSVYPRVSKCLVCCTCYGWNGLDVCYLLLYFVCLSAAIYCHCSEILVLNKFTVQRLRDLVTFGATQKRVPIWSAVSNTRERAAHRYCNTLERDRPQVAATPPVLCPTVFFSHMRHSALSVPQDRMRRAFQKCFFCFFA